MQAVILAAGMGRRLDPLTRSMPKCLVEVNGVPIIFNTLDILIKYDLSRIVIVVGHMADVVKKRVGKTWNRVPIEYVVNADFDKTNNIYSFWLARKRFNQDTILMECDVFFEEALMQKLLKGPIRNIALIDRFSPEMDGTVVEVTEEGKIGRLIPGRDQDEEFVYTNKYKTINIYTFTKKYLRDVFIPALEFYVKTQGRNQYYELILGALIYLGEIKIDAVSVEGIKWVEIDDFTDLERAENLFSEPRELFRQVNGIYGGYWRYGFVDFSYLYNMYFPGPQLINELKANLGTLIGHYPSGTDELINSLSNWVKMDVANLAIGNGASEIIRVLQRVFIKKMTLALPTFNEYETNLDADHINAVSAKNDDFIVAPDEFVDAVDRSKSNAALIINPGLPTSQFIQPKDLKSLIKRLKHIDIVILDESFVDFVSSGGNDSLQGELAEFKNLMIVRSLSKDAGVPGLRLGYAACANSHLIKRVRDELPIWNINSIAQHFLAILPKYRREYEAACGNVIKDRDYFYMRLKEIKEIRPYPPSANFIFVRINTDVASDVLKEYLFVHANVLIKDCSNKKGLENKKYIRLAVRKKEEIDRFIPQFQQALKALKNC